MSKMVPASQSGSVIRFGVFEADLRSGELRKNGIRVKIQELPFRALKLLLSRPNEVLSREEFRKALWPEDVYVAFDHGISSAINRLRDALGDSADNPVFIETLDRRGYRWIAPTSILFPSLPPTPKPAATNPTPLKQTSPAPIPDVGHHPIQAGNRLPANPSLSLARRSWVLIFPLAALILAAWGFKPVYRAAKAAAVKPPARSHAAAGSANPDSGIPDSGTSGAMDRTNAEAEQFYLKGRFYWQKRTPGGLDKAVDSFTQAIIRDPDYAPAYVGLADCYNLLREYTLMPASEAYPRALAAARRAVQLDDQSSDAHASLAFALFWGTWDAAGAQHEFRRSIELNPNNAVAHHWYATFLNTVGRHSESLAEIERAQALDPASKAILADKGELLAANGRREEALTLLKQLEAAEPDFISPHRYLKEINFASSDYPAYLSEWRTEATLMHDPATLRLVEAASKGFSQNGFQGMLRSEQSVEKTLYQRGSLSPYALAQTDALLGEKQEALRLLALAYEKHDEHAVNAATDPSLNCLHDDPAYRDLVAKLAFPPHE